MPDRDEFKDKVQKKAKKKVKRKIKSKAKSKAKRVHTATWVFAALALLVGIGVGVGACAFVCRDDCFKLKGDANYTVAIGADITYSDEGVKIISFGRDISADVEIDTNLKKVGEGKYKVDTSKPTEYYIIYTVEDAKYGDIQRVRTITVKGE